MNPLFSLNILVILLTLETTTQSFPLRHLGSRKDLSVYREKRTPVLCWVVQVHAGFKCQSGDADAVRDLELTQKKRIDHSGQRDGVLDGVNRSNCTKQHYNEIAKELQLAAVHVFSKFSNHVLMCFLEEEGTESKKATLSSVHSLHPGLLRQDNKAAFVDRKNTIENLLHSHAEITSFHAEYTHQRASRTEVPKDGGRTVTDTVGRNSRQPSSRFDKDRVNRSNSSNLTQANSKRIMATFLNALYLSINTNKSSLAMFQRLFSNLSSQLSTVFQEESLVKSLRNNNKEITYQSSNYELCHELTNLLKSSKMIKFELFERLCKESKSSSSIDFSRDVRSDFFKLIHLLAHSTNSLLLPNRSLENDNLTKSAKVLRECIHTVINSIIQTLCNKTAFHRVLDCSLFPSSSNYNAVFDRSNSNKNVCRHCKQHLLRISSKAASQPTSTSSIHQTLLNVYRIIIAVFIDSVLCPSHRNSLVNTMDKNNSVDSFDLPKKLELVNFKDPSSFVQQFNQRNKLLPYSSSSLPLPLSLKLKLSLHSPLTRKRRFSSSPFTSSFNDPAYPRQWHLHNIATPSMDVNVTSVWDKGYNGSGVTVAVVDDGLQWRNDDLKANYEYRGSWDLNDDDPDPSPSTKKLANHHGTRCAGEIAAVANNSLCGVGVAYGAKISGIRVLDGVMTDSLEAEAFNKAMQVNDVYSCSWGPDDDGKTVDGPHLMAARAMRHGVEFGRQGYGSVYVVASGNGGLHQDNCNFDGYANSIYTVTVGAVDESGLMPYYAEECASMLGVTFSSGTTNKRDIVTTDWTYHNPDGCTEKHTGTSAAAPLAAGMVALMLQARPCLSWRDVQFILILTAKKVDVDIAHWQTNGAGLSHSHKHGFGLLSSWRMVNAARVWQSVPWMTSFSHTNDLSDHGGLDIPKSGSNSKKSGKRSSLVVWDEVRQEDIRGYSLFTLESVQVTVWLSHPCRGDLSIKLVSPSGTVSVIAAARPNDNSSSGFQDWTFTTVRCWGESPVGKWTLEINDKDVSKHGKGRLTKWRLTLFGSPMSRSEFDERRSLVESAMGGQYLDHNLTRPCPPLPQKTDEAETISEKTLKIVLLCGIFCLIMGLYETFEYMCCYNEEKQEHQQEVEQMRTAQRMTERTLRALESEYQQTGVPMTDDAVTRNVRTINDLSSFSLSPMNSNHGNTNTNCGDGGRGFRNNNNNDNNNSNVINDDDVWEDVEEDDEDDLFDAAETSGLLASSSSSRNANDINDNHSSSNHHRHSSSLSSSPSASSPLSSNSSRFLHKSQTKMNSISHSIQNKLSGLSALIGIGTKTQRHNRSSNSNSINGNNDRLSIGNNDDYENDDDENDLFDASSSSSNSKLLPQTQKDNINSPSLSKLLSSSPSSSSSPPPPSSATPNVPQTSQSMSCDLGLEMPELTSTLAGLPSSSSDPLTLTLNHSSAFPTAASKENEDHSY